MKRAARLLPALAALFFLGACTAQARVALHGDAADEYGWGANVEGGAAQLVFGVAESDNVWFGFYCQPGSAQVEFTDFGPAPASHRNALTLVSGGASATAKVVREADPLFEEVGNGALDAGAPLLAEFRRTGRLGMPGGPTAADGYSAGTHAEMAAIEGFFSACGVKA